MGEVIPLRTSVGDLDRLRKVLRQAGAQAMQTYEAAHEHLVRALEQGQQAQHLLDSARELAKWTTEFCRKCQDASGTDDLTIMVEQRDRLARELAEFGLARSDADS